MTEGLTNSLIPLDSLKAISLYDRACHALAEARAVDEVKDVIDFSAAMAEYMRRSKNHDLEADAVALRMDATRKLGEMMDAQRQTVGLNKGGGDHRVIEKPGALPTLASQGIDKNLAHQARTLASLNEATYEQRRTEARAAAGRIVRRVVNEVRIEQERQRYRERTYEGGTVDDLSALAASGYRAGVIYPDPPWPFYTYSKQGRQRTPDRHYDEMSIEEIMAMAPVISALAAPDCASLLWGTWPDLDAARDFIRACEFNYKTVGFVWVKTNPNGGGLFVEEDDYNLATGMGFYTRANTEYCLLATRGKPLRLAADVHQVIMAPRLAHSEKPEEVARRIERLYPGPYLDLFARRERPGWQCWGNELGPAHD